MEENWQIKISKWLETLSFQSINELWKLAQGLKEKQEELDEYSFKVPYDKLKGIRGDLKSWLINLHKKKIVSVWTNPPPKKNKVGSISIGTPITDDENILFDPTTQVELDSKKFDYFFTLIEKKQTQLTNKESDNVQGANGINGFIKKISSQRLVKKIIKLYEFPTKQKAFLNALSDCKPQDTKMLKENSSINSEDLKSLKRDTKNKITSYGLSKILIIKNISGGGGFPKHFYQLEVNHQEYYRTHPNT